MSATLALALLWAGFAGSHMGLSSLPVRSRLVAVFAALHRVVNGAASDVVFFGAFSLVGARHQDQRKLATSVPGYREFVAATPFLPFTGRATLRGLRELPPLGIAIGVGLTVVLRVFHSALFGP